ncbi:MAG: aminotransferase class V-fold PLP-dependent enzyme [Gemmatimonadota bacterium]|nr:aminotransferase class V-fold PLP-dependent enzyme [Gemmatimonadota bacterium]
MANRPPTPLASQRSQFELPDDVTYLNCATLSPHLRAVAEAGMGQVRKGRTPWLRGAEDWFERSEQLRAAAGRLMGSDPEGVALVPSASYGIATAAANVEVRSGQNIVVLHEQFPSNVYAWRELARERGAEVRTVRRGPTDSWTAAVLDGIDEDTAVVAVPNAHWTDGALVDLPLVGEAARAVGAALLVDASQSLGAYPIDVTEVRPDFMISVGYKWQLGPYGLAYLYVSPKWRETGRPLESSWLSRANAEDFTTLVKYTDELRRGARRFDMGGYPQFILTSMALAALSQLDRWTVERVAVTLERLTGMLATEAQSLGCSVLGPDKRVGHMLGIRPEGGIPKGLPAALTEAGVHVSMRGEAIRVSPHAYNDEADVGRFLEVLERCLRAPSM